MHNVIFTPEPHTDFELLELKSVCRICLHRTKNLSSLFNNGIDSLISDFLPEKVGKVPLQPHQICSECIEKAKMAYIFKKQCEYSDQLIKFLPKVTEIRETFEKQTQTDFTNFMYPCEKCEIKCDSLGKQQKLSLEERCKTPNTCCENKEEEFPKHEKNVSKITGVSLTSNKYKKYETRFSKKNSIKKPLVGTHEANKVLTEKDDVNHGVTKENHCKSLQIPTTCREGKEEKFPKNEKIVTKVTGVSSKKYKKYGTRFSKKNIKKPLVGTHEAKEVFTEKDEVNDDCESNLKNHECPIFSETEEHCNKNDKTNVNECNLEFEDSFISGENENSIENISSKSDIDIIDNLKVAEDIAKSMIEESRKKINLNRGKVAKNSNGKYECQICKKVYGNTNGYWNHQIAHSDDPKPYSCTMCSKSYPSPVSLKNHVIGFHSKLRPFKCLTCDKAFKKLSHRNVHSLKNCSLKKPAEMKISCEKCFRKFWTEKHLQDHIASQHDETSEFICKCCKQKVIGAREYKKHCQVCPALKKKFLCSECGKSFAKSQHLLCHKKVHIGRKRLKCRYCDKFFSQEYLLLHERSHTGKRFHCAICSKSYITSYQLQVHTRRHTGQLLHKCLYCQKSFLTSEKLQIHTRIHTGERPHKCSYCPRDFTQRTDLIAHHRRHTGERFHCDVCGSGFIQMYLLRRHKQKAHGINELRKSLVLENKN